MSPNPKIADYSNFDGIDEYDRVLNADLYREFKELRKEMNLRISGTYTPTLTNTTNITASTAYACQYIRVGSAVTVSGLTDVDPTAAGAMVLGISLPIASALAVSIQCAGVIASSGESGNISGDVANSRARCDFTAVNTANHTFAFTFTYQIL